jgi:hypothetical protein
MITGAIDKKGGGGVLFLETNTKDLGRRVSNDNSTTAATYKACFDVTYEANPGTPFSDNVEPM